MKKFMPSLLSLSLLLVLSIACALPSVPVGPGTSTPGIDPGPTRAIRTPTAGPTLAETPTTLDPCLPGAWRMDAYALNNKFLDLTASPSMFVIAPSAVTLELRDDNSFSTGGQITIRFDIPSTSDYIEMDGFPSGQGSFATDGSLLSFSGVTFNVDFGEMRAFINGEQSQAPFGSMPMPTESLAPPASADYVCSGNSLVITYPGPAGLITEEWTR